MNTVLLSLSFYFNDDDNNNNNDNNSNNNNNNNNNINNNNNDDKNDNSNIDNNNKGFHKLSAGLLNIRGLTPLKSNYVIDTINSNNFDFFALTEIWGEDKIRTVRSLATPPFYHFFHSCRENRRGGGIGLVCKIELSPSILKLKKFSMFEVLGVKFRIPAMNIISIYRTGPCTKVFYHEFSELLIFCESLSVPYLILGDFNLHVSKIDDNSAKSFQKILDLFSLKQQVVSPTHIHGNILDLVISNFEIKCLNIVDPSNTISDHFLVSFSFDLFSTVKSHRPKKLITFRDIKSIDLENFKIDIHNILATANLNLSVNDSMTQLLNILTDCLNKHAPLKTRNIVYRYNCDYFNDELRILKRGKRAHERKYKQARLRNSPDVAQLHKNYSDASKNYFKRLQDARENHSLQVISEANGDCRVLYNLCEKLINNLCVPSSTLSANDLSEFFEWKIENIRTSITPCTSPIISSSNPLIEFTNFRLTTTD